MNAAEDDDGDRSTPVAPDSEYPPRQTGKYRIKDLPAEVPVPATVSGRPEEGYYTFIRDQFHRQDAITKEQRYALVAYQSYVDDKLDAQTRDAVELREMVVQAIGVLQDLGTTVAALKHLPDIVAELGRDVRQLRRCMRRLEASVTLNNTEVKNISNAQAEFEGRLIASHARLESSVDARLQEMWASIHRLEEELDIRDEDDEEDDDAGETSSPGNEDPPGSSGDPSTAC
jgi:hypothetical protein